ncbi:MAG: glycoside hydrolase family 43 protein [Marmoricola sp.]
MRSLRFVGVGLILVVMAGLAAESAAVPRVPAPVGSDRFIAKRAYAGDFPDPSVLRVGKKWYAYSTTVASLNLPAITSKDLSRWKVIAKRRGTHDAFPTPGKWVQSRRVGRRWFANTWAPSVARIGKRFVLACSAPVAGQAMGPDLIRKYCVSVAVARRPAGPFRDRSASPLICPPNTGVIDPAIFIDPAGTPWLYWKTEQAPRRACPHDIWATTQCRWHRFCPSAPVQLLQTEQPWEGILIENPSMVAFANRFYLFYSGGSYAKPSYATDYAICESQLGPCVRAANSPVLTSGAGVDGPGGAVPSWIGRVDYGWHMRPGARANFGYPNNKGCLRTPEGCAQRHLHVATLTAAPDGSLLVVNRG